MFQFNPGQWNSVPGSKVFLLCKLQPKPSQCNHLMKGTAARLKGKLHVPTNNVVTLKKNSCHMEVQVAQTRNAKYVATTEAKPIDFSAALAQRSLGKQN